MTTNDGMTPPQPDGASKDLRHSETMYDVDDAEELFLIAKERLLNVNHWQEIADNVGIKFTLCDIHGHELHRHAHKGDNIRINLHGQQNYDWILIDAIQYDDYPDESSESIAIHTHLTTLTPTDPVAGSSLIIHRVGRIVTATYTTNINQAGAVLQWNALLKGFLKIPD